MKPARMLAVALFALALPPVVRGGEPAQPYCPPFLPRYLCECLFYCGKPLPPLPCGEYCESCVPYCPKPAPPICSPRYDCRCDDYCRKPFPCCWPRLPCQ